MGYRAPLKSVQPNSLRLHCYKIKKTQISTKTEKKKTKEKIKKQRNNKWKETLSKVGVRAPLKMRLVFVFKCK